MADPISDIEPYYGWLGYYDPELDGRSPFAGEGQEGAEERYLYTFAANPRWESIGSESLLAKLLYVNYAAPPEGGFAIVELLGEWNDLFENDWRLLCDNCLDWLLAQGVNRFILICENVFHIYLEGDDYYADFAERLADAGEGSGNNTSGNEGWVCLLRARPEVQAELTRTGIGAYFYWNSQFDGLRWRKLKPWELYALVAQSLTRLLGTGSG